MKKLILLLVALMIATSAFAADRPSDSFIEKDVRTLHHMDSNPVVKWSDFYAEVKCESVDGAYICGVDYAYQVETKMSIEEYTYALRAEIKAGRATVDQAKKVLMSYIKMLGDDFKKGDKFSFTGERVYEKDNGKWVGYGPNDF